MKDYKKSDYALNKNRKGIVYRNADGSTLEITFEKIAEGKPQFTYEDFQKLKQFSDSIYLEQVKADGRYLYYVKGSYDEIPDFAWLATKSLEEELFGDTMDLPSLEEVRRIAGEVLTPTQKRRFLMYLEGLTTVKIAEIEGCNQKSVWESLEAAKEKIQKYLKNF